MDDKTKAIVAATDPVNILAAFTYLDDLRTSGSANMFTEAPQKLYNDHPGEFSWGEAKAIVWAWQETFDRQTPIEVRALKAYADANGMEVIDKPEDVFKDEPDEDGSEAVIQAATAIVELAASVLSDEGMSDDASNTADSSDDFSGDGGDFGGGGSDGDF